MARINTNVASLAAQTNLGRAQSSLNTSLQRLSSGLRINSGADDPAGLVASESLRSEMAGINSAIQNSQQASNVISTADGALTEVSNLLINIKQLTVQSASTGGVSPDEIKANQLQVDSAVESITRIANVTNFAGLKLLDGTMDYTLSGVDNAAVTGAQVYNAQFGSATSLPVNIHVINPATTAELEWRTSAVSSGTTISIAGTKGVATITLGSGEAASAVLFAVNQQTAATGVRAVFINNANPASGIAFYSTDYGSKALVSVKAMTNEGSFDTYNGATKTAQSHGTDIQATINGNYAVGDGLNLSLNNANMSVDVTMDKSQQSTSFSIIGGGALFQLGPHVSLSEQRSFGIQSIAANNLGNNTVGYLSQVASGGGQYTLGKNAAQAAAIADAAISQVASLRGRLGAFEKNTLETNIASLQVALQNVTSSQSTIRDADFATETANLTRGQILTQAATSVLAIANSQPSQVLSLLKGA